VNQETFMAFEDKVRLLVAHVRLLKKENLALRDQVIEQKATGGLPGKERVVKQVQKMISLIDQELATLQKAAQS